MALTDPRNQNLDSKLINFQVIISVDDLNTHVVSATSSSSTAASDLDAFSNGEHASKASARIHLFTLLFEDCKILCAKIVDEARAVEGMTR